VQPKVRPRPRARARRRMSWETAKQNGGVIVSSRRPMLTVRSEIGPYRRPNVLNQSVTYVLTANGER